MAVVYRHIRLDKNEVFYIGIGKKESRAYDFKSKNRNFYWNNIFNKTKIEVEIIFYDLTWEQAQEKEFIKLYGRKK